NKSVIAFNRVFFSSPFRLAKEEISYINEARQQEEKVERLKAEGEDEFVIKKQGPKTHILPSIHAVFASFGLIGVQISYHVL
ncbi:hypothetical protein XENOCAPTIV_026779, partial [Xenoophorus captivus]